MRGKLWGKPSFPPCPDGGCVHTRCDLHSAARRLASSRAWRRTGAESRPSKAGGFSRVRGRGKESGRGGQERMVMGGADDPKGKQALTLRAHAIARRKLVSDLCQLDEEVQDDALRARVSAECAVSWARQGQQAVNENGSTVRSQAELLGACRVMAICSDGLTQPCPRTWGSMRLPESQQCSRSSAAAELTLRVNSQTPPSHPLDLWNFMSSGA